MLRSIYTLLLPLAIGLTTLAWVALRGQLDSNHRAGEHVRAIEEIARHHEIHRQFSGTVAGLVQEALRDSVPGSPDASPPLDLAERFARELQLAIADAPRLERLVNRASSVQDALELVVGARVNGEPQTILAAQGELFSAHRLLERDLRRLDQDIPTAPHKPAPPTTIVITLAVAVWIVVALALASLRNQLKSLPRTQAWSYREIAAASMRWQSAIRGAASAQGNLDEQRVALQQERAKAQRLERALAQAGLYNENLLNSLRSCVLTTDLEFKIESANLAARSTFRSEGLQVGASALSTELGEALAKVVPELGERLSEKDALRSADLEVELGETGTSHFDLRILSRKNEHNQSQGFLWMADDIGDAVAMKNALLRAEHLAAIGRLSAQVTHEIRNPLSAIGLNTEMLAEEIAEGTEAKELLDAISREIDRLSQITDSYLELARAPTPHLQPTDVHTLIRDLVSFMKPELSRDRVEIAVEPAADRCEVEADAGQLRQALLNLLGNARDAMPEGGKITLRTSNQDERFEIQIEDGGSGIADTVLGRVFEPFFSTKQEGTGLGLPLTQQIIEQHQGFIELRNREGGGGTLAFVSLPNADSGP